LAYKPFLPSSTYPVLGFVASTSLLGAMAPVKVFLALMAVQASLASSADCSNSKDESCTVDADKSSLLQKEVHISSHSDHDNKQWSGRVLTKANTDATVSQLPNLLQASTQPTHPDQTLVDSFVAFIFWEVDKNRDGLVDNAECRTFAEIPHCSACLQKLFPSMTSAVDICDQFYHTSDVHSSETLTRAVQDTVKLVHQATELEHATKFLVDLPEMITKLHARSNHIDKAAASLKTGSEIKVFSPSGIARACTVADTTDTSIKVHYDGYDEQHDEWLQRTATRIVNKAASLQEEDGQLDRTYRAKCGG